MTTSTRQAGRIAEVDQLIVEGDASPAKLELVEITESLCASFDALIEALQELGHTEHCDSISESRPSIMSAVNTRINDATDGNGKGAPKVRGDVQAEIATSRAEAARNRGQVATGYDSGA